MNDNDELVRRIRSAGDGIRPGPGSAPAAMKRGRRRKTIATLEIAGLTLVLLLAIAGPLKALSGIGAQHTPMGPPSQHPGLPDHDPALAKRLYGANGPCPDGVVIYKQEWEDTWRAQKRLAAFASPATASPSVPVPVDFWFVWVKDANAPAGQIFTRACTLGPDAQMYLVDAQQGGVFEPAANADHPIGVVRSGRFVPGAS